MGYSKQALLGFSWQTVLKMVLAGITVVKIAILARLLSPNDFGVFSLVTIALGVTESTTQTGVNITLLQLKDSLTKYISSAWIIAIVRGIIMAAIMLILGNALANYYRSDVLQPLIWGASLIPIIKGFINPYIIVMQKEFQFGKEAWYYAVLQLIEAVVAVCLAFFFQSAWVLVIAMIVAALIEVLISFLCFSVKPRFSYNHSAGKTILARLKHFSLNALASYLLENIDNIIVGKILGTTNLGYYHNGYTIAHKPNYEFAKSLNHSAFPVFNKIVEDKQRIKKGFSKLFISSLVLITILSLPLFLFPELIITLALGSQWLILVSSLPWLISAGMIQSLILIQYTLLFAYKKITTINIHLIVSLSLLVPFLIFGSNQLGLEGAAMAVFFSRLLSLPLLLLFTLKLLK